MIRLAIIFELLGYEDYVLAGNDFYLTVAQTTTSVVVLEMIQDIKKKLCTN